MRPARRRVAGNVGRTSMKFGPKLGGTSLDAVLLQVVSERKLAACCDVGPEVSLTSVPREDVGVPLPLPRALSTHVSECSVSPRKLHRVHLVPKIPHQLPDPALLNHSTAAFTDADADLTDSVTRCRRLM